jgi:hypothetical protein
MIFDDVRWVWMWILVMGYRDISSLYVFYVWSRLTIYDFNLFYSQCVKTLNSKI